MFCETEIRTLARGEIRALRTAVASRGLLRIVGTLQKFYVDGMLVNDARLRICEPSRSGLPPSDFLNDSC